MRPSTWRLLVALPWVAFGHAFAQSRPTTTPDLEPGAPELVAELSRMGDPTPAALARAADLIGHRDSGVRALALEILLSHASRAGGTLPTLHRHLASTDPAIHACATAALSVVGATTPRSPRALARILTNGDSPTRWQALAQLAALGTRATPAIGAVAALVSDPDASLAHQALSALGAIGRDAPETPLLLQSIARDPKVHPTLRCEALRRLAQVAPDAALTALDTFCKDGGDHLWAAAVATVRELLQSHPEARAQVAALVRSTTRARRHQFLIALPDSAFAPEELVAHLAEDLESDQDRTYALDRLARLGSAAHQALPKMAMLLDHSQATVRAKVLDVLASFGTAARSHAEAIATLALDPNPEVALAAVGALISCTEPDPRTSACIEKAMRHWSPRVRASAAAIAAATPGTGDSMVLALADRLCDPDPVVRDAATRGLQAVDTEWVRSRPLAETHPSPRVRAVLLALCEKRAIEGPPRGLAALIATEDPRAKLAFLKALRTGFAARPLEIRALGAMLREGPQIAGFVLEALVLCGEQALPLLADLAALDVTAIADGAVRRRAAVLAMGPGARKELLGWLGNPTRATQALALVGELGIEGAFARDRIVELVLTRNPLTPAALRTLERIGVAEVQLAGLRTLHAERERIDTEVASAIDAFGEHPDRLVRLTRSTDAYARATAIAAAVRIGETLGPELVRIVALALGDDNAGVRAAAITALRSIRNPAVERALREVRCAGPREVRIRAALLARAVAPEARTPITVLRLGMADETVAIQELALQIVVRQGSPAALELVVDFARTASKSGLESAVRCLTVIVLTPDPRLRRAARDGLKTLLAERSTDFGIELAAETRRLLGQPDVKPDGGVEPATPATSPEPDPEPLPSTVAELVDGLRERPAETLRSLNAAPVAEQARLVKALGSECLVAGALDLRALLVALVQVGELARFAVEELMALVQESDPTDPNFAQVTAILTRIGPPGIDALQTLALRGANVESNIIVALERSDLRTPSPAIMAAIALRLTGPRVLTVAEHLLANGSEDVRMHAASLLLAAAEDDPAAGPAVARLLGTDSVFHRGRAAEVLAKWPANAARAIPELLELLLEDRAELRAAGLRALTAAGPAAAIARTAIEEATRDPVPEIAEAARRLLR